MDLCELFAPTRDKARQIPLINEEIQPWKQRSVMQKALDYWIENHRGREKNLISPAHNLE